MIITNSVLSQPIISLVETTDKGCSYFLKSKVLARIMALAISFFQLLDFLWSSGCFIAESIAVLADKIGCGFVPTERLRAISLEKRVCDVFKAFLGTMFGSAIAFVAPRCVVPFCFAPTYSPFQHPKDLTIKYPLNNCFDKIYVLNLKKDTNKLAIVDAHFKEIGVNYERFEAFNGRENLTKPEDYQQMIGQTPAIKQGRMGCYRSHLDALKKAKAEGAKNVLIFEDDVIFPQNSESVKHFEQAMQELPENWDLLFLGCDFRLPPDRYTTHLDRVHSALCLHAYAINAKAFDGLIKALEDGLQEEQVIPVDHVYLNVLEQNTYQAFSCNPLLAEQRDGSPSSITTYTNDQKSLACLTVERFYTYCLAPILYCLGIRLKKVGKVLPQIY